MTNEIIGRSLEFVEIDVDLYRATQFEAVKTSGHSIRDLQKKLLMNFEEPNGGTAFIDSSPNQKVFTPAGSAQVTNVNPKFGIGAGLFPGPGSGGYITTPAHADFNLQNLLFTIHGWFNNIGPLGTANILMGQIDAATSATSRSFIIGRGATGNIFGNIGVGALSLQISGTTIYSNVNNIGWHHFAFVRVNANTFRLFLDGVQEGGDLIESGALNSSTANVSIGREGDFAGIEWFGKLDALEIIAGEALWTANFTPPTRAPSLSTEVANWTSRWDMATTAIGAEDTTGDMPSGKILRLDKQINNDTALWQWNIMPDIADVSVLAYMRSQFNVAGTSLSIFVRTSGDDVTKTGYHFQLLPVASGVGGARFNKIVNGSGTNNLATISDTLDLTEPWWMLFEVINTADGVQLRANYWQGELTDQPRSFQLTFIDDTASQITAAGGVGVGVFSSNDDITEVGVFRARSMAAFNNGMIETLRYTMPASYLPQELHAIPNIASVKETPVRLSLGENLGDRAQVEIKFRDHPHAELGEFYNSGTYWGKFRARNIFRRKLPLRTYAGLLSQVLASDPLADFETRHYQMDIFNGPTPDDEFSITAQDVLKFADNERAQAPRPSNGFLTADITNVATTASLSPAGIGNIEYPTSGFAAIGGDEIVSFVRSGDSIISMTRGQFGTVAAAHSAEDRFQLCVNFDAKDPAEIIYTLLTQYAEIDAAFIPLYTWLAETQTYLSRLYTRLIAEPTGVNTLISELIQQAGLIVWWDNLDSLIKLQVLRGILTEAFEYNENNLVRGDIRVSEQRNKILTEVWTYYGVRNPLEPLDQTDNYRSTVVVTDLEGATLNGSAIIKKIFGTWIPALGRPVAERTNDLQIGRFATPPRLVQFSVPRYSGITEPSLAGGFQFSYHGSQDEIGRLITFPIQVVKIEPEIDKLKVEAEEMQFKQFDPGDLVNRVITIDTNFFDFNLREAHDNIYPPITAADLIASPPVTLTCIVNAGVIVGSSVSAKIPLSGGATVSIPSFTVGDWPAGFVPLIQIFGRIQGSGGTGGSANTAGFFDIFTTGAAGGTALYTRHTVDLEIDNVAEIWGGGGGGGAGSSGGGGRSGGGGQGQIPGLAGDAIGPDDIAGTAGTTETPGLEGGVTAGDGGGAGEPGETGSTAGGAAGNAIDGITFVNVLTGYGDIRGPQVN